MTSTASRSSSSTSTSAVRSLLKDPLNIESLIEQLKRDEHRELQQLQAEGVPLHKAFIKTQPNAAKQSTSLQQLISIVNQSKGVKSKSTSLGLSSKKVHTKQEVDGAPNTRHDIIMDSSPSSSSLLVETNNVANMESQQSFAHGDSLSKFNSNDDSMLFDNLFDNLTGK